jgi:hypothetical protein
MIIYSAIIDMESSYLQYLVSGQATIPAARASIGISQDGGGHHASPRPGNQGGRKWKRPVSQVSASACQLLLTGN